MTTTTEDGRRKNGAAPQGPDPKSSDKDVREVGRRERKTAGPDGPDAKVVGDTFKR